MELVKGVAVWRKEIVLQSIRFRLQKNSPAKLDWMSTLELSLQGIQGAYNNIY